MYLHEKFSKTNYKVKHRFMNSKNNIMVFRIQTDINISIITHVKFLQRRPGKIPMKLLPVVDFQTED